MRGLKLISLMLVLAASHANAGDEGTAEYWSGTYLGAHFGAGAGTINQTFTDYTITNQQSFPNPRAMITTNGSGKRDGSITGANLDLFAGYNYHPHDSKFIVGGQLEGTLFNNTIMKASGLRKSRSQTLTLNNGAITANTSASGTNISEMTTELQSMFSFVGRAGYLAKPNTLLYALVGGTEGNFVLVENNSGGAAGGGGGATGNKLNQWQLGLTAGGGIEYKLSEHWSLLGEYRYLHFSFNQSGSLTSSSNTSNQLTQTPTFAGNTSSNQNTRSNFNFNLGQIGIVYRV